MKNINWNEKSYNEFVEYLFSLQDLKYREFHSGLGINKNYLIGVRTPILKKIAKNISLGDYNSFIEYNKHNTYEEILVHGLILGYLEVEFETVLNLFKKFIIYIDNWALCDLVCANLRIWNKNTKTGLKFVKWALNSKNQWYNRVGVVLLTNYYINDDYIEYILNTIKNYKTNDYYVIMGIAWLLSTCYIKYPTKTEILIKSNVLDKKIQNKTIQKIRESLRIDNKTKQDILKWRL